MRELRIERCKLRERVSKKGFERKTEPECQSDVRITNKKRMENNTQRNWLLVI